MRGLRRHGCTDVVLLILGLTVIAVQGGSLAQTGNLYNHIRNAFSKPRSQLQPEMKAWVRDYIRDFFSDLATRFQTEVEEHTFNVQWGTNQTYTGVNYVWVLPGDTYKTPADRLTLMTAHYDSVSRSPGVDDNGSGMAALLEAARVLSDITTLRCPRKHSVAFVAFDWEEQSLLGSENFVYRHLMPWLRDELGLPAEHFEGVVNLDSVMDWSSEPQTQEFPNGIQMLLPDVWRALEESDFAGNFITVISRFEDIQLASRFAAIWNQLPLEESHTVLLTQLPFSGRPGSLSTVEQEMMNDFFRSDHYNFWNYAGNYTRAQSGLRAIFLTDSTNFRGVMRQCYHEACDDLSLLTDGRLKFLAKVTETCIRFLSEKVTAKHHDHCLPKTDGWDPMYSFTSTLPPQTGYSQQLLPSHTVFLALIGFTLLCLVYGEY